MNALGLALDSYLAVRRALGFKLDEVEYLLRKFVEYAQQQHSSIVTAALALDWATQSNNAAPITHANRLIAVRGFARYLHASDPRHEVPPAELIPYRKIRYEPYIYSDEDVTALLGEAQVIPHPLMAATYTTLFGLLAVTGMRLGEALRLDRDDVDCNNAVLFVRDSKFNKSRELPLHSTSRDTLRTYAERRDELISRPRAPSFLLSTSGTRLISQNVHTKLLETPAKGWSESPPPPPTSDSRPAPLVRSQDDSPLVRSRFRRRAETAFFVDLPRSCQSNINLLVSDRHS